MKAWLSDHDSGPSLIHSTTGRGNGCEDIRENCASNRPKKRHEFLHERESHIMIANALLIALAVLLACLFGLMGELKFLVPYKRLIFHQYGTMLLAWLAILFVNLFAAVYWIQRKFFLKDTGRKLRHIDNQTSGGHTSMPLPNGDWNAR
jgi:hypothetical protein